MATGRCVLLGALAVPLLVLWARAAESNIGLPAWGNAIWGYVLIALGLAAAVAGRLIFPRPWLAGFSIACFGVAMTAQSRAGLWLVAPVVALGAGAYSVGHARLANPAPLRLLPEATDDPPDLLERVRYWFTVALPWVAMYEFTAHMRLPGRAFQFAFEDQWPIYPWTSILYQSTYLAVTVAPWLARTRRELRHFTICAWVATALVFPFYWLVPSTAPRRPMEVDGVLARLLAFERNANPPSVAFPSFHVLWSILIAPLVRPVWLGWFYAVSIAVTCITTGMHFIPDVLISFAIAPWLMDPAKRLWRPIQGVVAALGELIPLARLRSPVPVWTGSALLAVVMVCMWLQSARPLLMAGVFLIGEAMIGFVERGHASGALPDLRPQWPSALLLAGGAVLTIL